MATLAVRKAKEISKLRGGLADTQQAMAGKINQIKNFATQQEKLMGELVMARETNTRNGMQRASAEALVSRYRGGAQTGDLDASE